MELTTFIHHQQMLSDDLQISAETYFFSVYLLTVAYMSDLITFLPARLKLRYGNQFIIIIIIIIMLTNILEPQTTILKKGIYIPSPNCKFVRCRITTVVVKSGCMYNPPSTPS